MRSTFEERMKRFYDASPKQWVRLLRDHGPLRKGEVRETTGTTAHDWQRRGIVEFVDPPEQSTG